MNEYDAYFRAFKNYRKTTKDNNECKSSRNSLVNNLKEESTITATKFKVNIDEDWVKEIETKIIYIEKAVKEERQFIQTIGEVIPIEKVKKVSKESISHLARHSNFITREPEEGKDIIPEKIYMTEKNNDYAVYENRFLYFVLCFLKEFVGVRYEAINKAITTYKGNLVINKDLKQNSKTLKFNLAMEDVNFNNPYYTLSAEEKNLIERIDTIRFSIDMLLNTNLMIEVAKAPMIKLPIVKTNPIKMNNNFKLTLELFEFVNAYTKPGYEIIEDKTVLNPLENQIADEVMEIVKLSSFLTYQYGTNITELLKKEYEAEEARIKEKEKEALSIKIKNLKHRIDTEKISPHEYMLLLEESNRKLEADSKELVIVKNLLIEKEKENIILQENIKDLNQTIMNKNKEIEDLNLKYENDINELNNIHSQEMEETINDYETRIKEFNDNFDASLQHLIDIERDKIKDEVDELNDSINNLNNKIISLNNEKNDVINLNESNIKKALDEKSALTNEYEEKISELNNKYNDLENEKEKIDSINLAYRLRLNEKIDPNDFSKEDDFRDLDSLKKALDKLYYEAWKEAKKDIRKKNLWGKVKDYIASLKKNKNKTDDINDENNEELNNSDEVVSIDALNGDSVETKPENLENNISNESINIDENITMSSEEVEETETVDPKEDIIENFEEETVENITDEEVIEDSNEVVKETEALEQNIELEEIESAENNDVSIEETETEDLKEDIIENFEEETVENITDEEVSEDSNEESKNNNEE